MTSPYETPQSEWTKGNEDALEGSSGLRPSPATSRPRNRRLISTLDPEPASSDSSLRQRSPIPNPHPSQRLGVPRQMNGSARQNGGRSPSPAGSSTGNTSFGKGLWEGGLGFSGSWSTLQGIAQTVLGAPENNPGLDKSSGQAAPRRRNKNSLVPAPALKEWGPNGVATANNGQGREGETERGAMMSKFNTLRTASTLESHDGVNGGLAISSGRSRHKRKSSNDADAMNNILKEDEDGDALVYVHHVQPSDTLAGVILKYNVDPAILRKANRLWPNDAIQVRKVILVPVDASAVRGKPCEAPRVDSPGVDLLAPTPQDEEPPNLAEDSEWANGILSPSVSHQGHQKQTESGSQAEEEQPWVHVRWVLLSSSPNAQPTEIARLPRRTLGYFPPRRRKNSQGTLSPFATPRPSFDLTSSSAGSPGPSGVRGTPTRRLSNLSSSISSLSHGYFPPQANLDRDLITSAPSLTLPPSTTRPRASSRTHSIQSQSRSISGGGGPESWFRGPGGVGTFASNVRRPGPANDGLNSLISKHLPGLSMKDLPSTSSVGAAGSGMIEDQTIGWGFKTEMERLKDVALNSVGSGDRTPTGIGGGIDVGAAAQAIEGWVRRLGSRPSLQNLKSSGNGIGGRGRGEERMGDLIELLDGAGSDDGMGFEPTQSARAGSVEQGVRKRSGKRD